MQKKKILFILALICAVVQGAKADDGWSVWDGSSMEQPEVTTNGDRKVILIKSAANLAYIRKHWTERIDGERTTIKDDWCYSHDYKLQTNIDMTAKSWETFISQVFDLGYSKTFDGDGHTIKIKIDDGSSENSQGLFDGLYEYGVIKNLHMDVYIKVGNARKVGGIVGYNHGTIENCWVSGHVESDHYHSSLDADLGGIAGLNESSGKIKNCCVTADVKNTHENSGVGGIAGSNEGTIEHVTFYGSVSVDHSQYNKWVGDQHEDGTFNNYYDSFNQGEYDAASGNDLYRYAIKYPYAINVTTVGQGSVTVSAGGEDNIPGTRQHQEVTLTTTTGSTAEVTVTDADGNNLTLFGNSGASGYTFIMPQKNVNVHAIFTVPDWPRQGSGTTDSPYLITSADDWNEFALSVNAGINHSGKHVKLTNGISIWMMAGASETNSFQGTFDGDGHTLTFNCNNTTSAVTAPFRYTKNAIIKNLRTAGSIATDAMNAAGIVGDVTGSLSLTNCCSAVTISSSRSDADFHGGLVASNNGSVTISGCVFDGSFVATVAHTNQYGTTYCGGFVGYGGSNSSTTITNSLVATTSVSEGMVSHTFVVTDDGAVLSIGNSYFVATTNLPTNQGTEAAVLNITPANPDYDYGMVKAYKNGIWFDGNFYGTPATVTLADDADNTTIITGANGSVANVTLSGRTLYKDGAWNTICLPFNVTLAGSPLAGAEARSLSEASISGTTLNLTFGDAVNTLEAGTPYIIKWDGDGTSNIENPVFEGVTIEATKHDYDTNKESVTTDERVRFLGTYKSTAFSDEDKSILLMGGANKLYYPTSGAGLGAQRAYFKIGNDAAQASRLTSFNIDFGDEDNTTGIISLTPDPSPKGEGSEYWYSLDGRRLDTKPTKKGVYINNGRRIVIK